MSTKHTPGPWIAGVDVKANERPAKFDTDDVYSAEGFRVCRMTGDVASSYHNARLIAAAPEMLKLLRRCRDLLDQEYGWTRDEGGRLGFKPKPSELDELDSLIARTEGGAK